MVCETEASNGQDYIDFNRIAKFRHVDQFKILSFREKVCKPEFKLVEYFTTVGPHYSNYTTHIMQQCQR